MVNLERKSAVLLSGNIASGEGKAKEAALVAVQAMIASAIPALRTTLGRRLLLLELAIKSSDARRGFEVHVIVLVRVQLEKFLIRVERLSRLP